MVNDPKTDNLKIISDPYWENTGKMRSEIPGRIINDNQILAIDKHFDQSSVEDYFILLDVAFIFRYNKSLSKISTSYLNSVAKNENTYTTRIESQSKTSSLILKILTNFFLKKKKKRKIFEHYGIFFFLFSLLNFLKKK